LSCFDVQIGLLWCSPNITVPFTRVNGLYRRDCQCALCSPRYSGILTVT